MQSSPKKLPPKLLRPRELAVALGVSLNSVYNWIREKHIPVADGYKPLRLCYHEVVQSLSGKAQLVHFRNPDLALRPPQYEPEFITAVEAASLLGVPRVTIYRWAQKDILSHQLIGSRYLFRRDEVMSLLPESGRHNQQLISPTDAARQLQISLTSVRRKIQAGELKTVRFGQRYLIPLENVERLKMERKRVQSFLRK